MRVKRYNMECAYCKSEADFACGGCNKVFYCGTKCQSLGFQSHKIVCNLIGNDDLLDESPETIQRKREEYDNHVLYRFGDGTTMTRREVIDEEYDAPGRMLFGPIFEGERVRYLRAITEVTRAIPKLLDRYGDHWQFFDDIRLLREFSKSAAKLQYELKYGIYIGGVTHLFETINNFAQRLNIFFKKVERIDRILLTDKFNALASRVAEYLGENPDARNQRQIEEIRSQLFTRLSRMLDFRMDVSVEREREFLNLARAKLRQFKIIK